MPFTRRRPGQRDSRRRSGRLAWAYFKLACFVAVGAAAGFVAGFEELLDPAVAQFFAVVTVGWGVVLRFPRAVGLPVFFVLLAATLLLPVVRADWYALRGEAHVATLRILNTGGRSHTVEWIHAEPGFLPGEVGIMTAEGDGVTVELEVVRVPPQAFFFASDALVRGSGLSGLERSDGGRRPGEEAVSWERGDEGVAGAVNGLLVGGAMPGFETERTRADITRPILLSDYGLLVQPDGTGVFARQRR